MRIVAGWALAIITFFLSINSEAAAIDIGLARKVAKNFYSEKSGIPLHGLIAGEEFILKSGGVAYGYAFNLNTGFIIISGDDAVFPVLAYSFESGYTNDHLPPGFTSWMECYKSQVLLSLEEKPNPSKNIYEIWSRYGSENYQAKAILSEVKPLIHTTWSQDCFYNSYFPEEPLAPCGHLWTGCVATAMSQVMKYYNYPENGSGSYSYNSSYGYVSADFENTDYDWVSMNYHLTGEDSATAHLLYHTAISIHSQFFPNGTGAYDFDVRDALVQYFNYSEDAHFYWRDSYPGDWKALLRNELDNGRPVIYGGASSETLAGHTLVCDGYQDTSFFHFNWGWNGTYNGYFYLDSLIAGENYFDFQHDVVVGIKPDISGVIVTSPPENIIASVIEQAVNLSWNTGISGSLELLGFNIFRDGLLVNTAIITGNNFTDANVPEGDHQYTLTSVYIGAESEPSSGIPVYINAVDEIFYSRFTVYPNPATDDLIVLFDKPISGKLNIGLIDLGGKIILEQILWLNQSDKLMVRLPESSSGIYFLQMKTTDTIVTKKIIIY